jgi:NCAIR mutase (PurE)-related protein
MVVTGGTSDLPVAEEAAQTLEFLGNRVVRAYDIGVSGVHRLLDQQSLLSEADVIISIAGMEAHQRRLWCQLPGHICPIGDVKRLCSRHCCSEHR